MIKRQLLTLILSIFVPFSAIASAEQVTRQEPSKPNADSRPDFAILFFPGHLCRRGGKLDPSIQTTKNTPPTFLLQAWDDPVNKICNSTLYARALNTAGVPAEVHLFARGGHAFGLRRDHSPDTAWPALALNWLKDINILRQD
ncbi:alpha/beta hydrolase [Microbulbifer aggregans]|uniref:alpha/beta hydrolase n=1 Tax=Microbulbifer aggregans TaxID=1769779 RepID=UPI001CFECE00|nr:hypothetical protein [Microbulbifer aggregans]